MTFEMFWLIGFILYWVILFGMMWVDNYLNHYNSQIDDHASTVVVSLFPVVNAVAALFLFVLLCCVVWDGRQIIASRFILVLRESVWTCRISLNTFLVCVFNFKES